MILRRVTEHVKDQNWFAVLLDFLIVVVGILIAFQITEWNEDRINGENRERYIEELIKDLELAVAEIDETIAHAQMRVDAGHYLFGGGDEPPVTPTFRRMTKMFDVPNAEDTIPTMQLPLIFSMARMIDEHGAVYQELVSTGNIGVLRDPDLVRALSEYYSRYQEIQTGDGWNLDSSLDMKKQFQENGIAFTMPLAPEEFVAIIQNDPSLAASVRDTATLAEWQINRTNILRDNTEALMARLKAAK